MARKRWRRRIPGRRNFKDDRYLITSNPQDDNTSPHAISRVAVANETPQGQALLSPRCIGNPKREPLRQFDGKSTSRTVSTSMRGIKNAVQVYDFAPIQKRLLVWAILSRNQDGVEKLIKFYGENIQRLGLSWTQETWRREEGVCWKGGDDIAVMLLEAGCRPANEDIECVVLYALRKKVPRTASAFIHIAHHNYRYRSALTGAMERELLSAISYELELPFSLLLKHGARLLASDHHELAFQALNEAKEVKMEMLLRSGLNPDMATRRDGLMLFDLAVKQKHFSMVRMIVTFSDLKKHSIQEQDFDLEDAINGNNIRLALQYIQHGAQPLARAMKLLQNSGQMQSPITGSQNQYIAHLCKRLVYLSQKIGRSLCDGQYDDSHTSSDRATFQASMWLFQCFTKHPSCIKAETQLPILPSRVLDVGLAADFQDLRLVETNGRQDRYMTLSHRWGNLEVAKTTTHNITEQLKKVKFASLTKTMQDAVIITQSLGIRYLWIDALCIIQDSHSDWSTEACDMARIYRNSVLTIAASSATAHTEGCFTERCLTHPERASPLDFRGWCLQEQLLSPRILKYHEGRIEWECITGCAIEISNSNLPPHTISTEARRFKQVLQGIRPTSMTLQQQALTSWHHVVHSYSKRTLTKKADKLAAIAGIANFLGDIIGDQLLAGIWRKHLWRELLWNTDVNPYQQRLPLRLTNLSLPSWSWASIDGPVTYSVKDLHVAVPYSDTPICLITADNQDEAITEVMQIRLVIQTKRRRVFQRPRHELSHLRLFHEPNGGYIHKGMSDYELESPRNTLSTAQMSTRIHLLVSRHFYQLHRDHEAQYHSSEPLTLLFVCLALLPSFLGNLDEIEASLKSLLGSPGEQCLLLFSILATVLFRFMKKQYMNKGSQTMTAEEELRRLLAEPEIPPSDRSEAFWPDTNELRGFKEIWLCPVAQHYYHYYCLAVVPTRTSEPNEFRRIGLCLVQRQIVPGGIHGVDFFEGLEDETIILV